MSFLLVFFTCLVTTASSQSGCGPDSYTDPVGVISSPSNNGNYENLLDCNYNVYASGDSSLTFIFSSFHVEIGDVVTISCPTNASFTPLEYSGHSLPGPVSIPWCSHGLINFRTDDSLVSTGFNISYYASVGGCGDTLFTGVSGNVTSPNWPDHYGYNHNCSNIIWTQQQSTVHLHFRKFELGSCCDCDKLLVTCIDNPETALVIYCGNNDDYTTLIFRCSQVILWFHSDDTNNFPGFNIEYNIYENGDCGKSSYYDPSGIIRSPNYPFPYNRNLDCDYDINTTSALSSIGIVFQAFNTEENFDTVTISCPTNSSFSSLRYSGSSLPQPVSIPWCSLGRVNFHSDESTVHTGFMLNYYISLGGCGNTVYNGSHGYVASPNYPGNYNNNQNCSNIIWASKPASFVISFLHMDVEDCCDFVELNCLDNPAYGTHKFSGTTLPPTQTIPDCTQVLVWFFSDVTDVFGGFNLEYNATQDPDTTIFPGTTAPPTTTSTSTPPASVAPTTPTVPQPSVAPTTPTVPQPSVAPTTPTVPQPSVAPTTPTVPQPSVAPTTPTVPQHCGNTTYYGPSGVISSPNHPGNYSNYQTCNYYVDTSSPSSSIAVVFQAFDTEQCCDYVTIGCPSNSFYPSVKYSGSSLPQPLSIPWCSQAAVNFTSDSATVSSGFSLDYYVSLGGCGDTVYTGSHGLVSSPHYPNSYDSDQNCSNIIWSRLRSSFSITFLYMNIEECCDFVELSCLDNAGFGSHRFTGTSIPEKLDIPGCTQVLVWFYADDTIVQTGFNLEYFVAPDSDDHGQRKVPN